MSNELIRHLSDAQFNDAINNNDTPILVDFWAPWCGPCRAVAPVLDNLADEFEGKVAIAKIDVDANPETAAALGIRGIPTLLVFKNGEKVAQHVGAASYTQLKGLIEQAL